MNNSLFDSRGFPFIAIYYNRISLFLWTCFSSSCREHFHISYKFVNHIISCIFLVRWLNIIMHSVQFSSVQSLSHVGLFETPWIAACQASLSITNSRSSLRLTSIKSMMPSSHFILCRPQSLPASESFPMIQLFTWGGQSTGVSALASFLPKKSQGWSPSEWTGCISLHSKGLSGVFSNTAV